jgi:lipopolysaccharide transport system ATP-binding protein
MAAITTKDLGKRYVIRHQPQHGTLKDAITFGTKGVLRRVFSPPPKTGFSKKEEFWALRGVSLEIGHGDRVGFIGRNGAGKSTLLKLLSRITEPTTGSIHLRGRVASLLEVGTGFHPELTGRENIFLNGAILGMSRTEIKRNFDEIVDFSGVEKFLDTPVKRYSSGMYVRLAFAVAAHLEPEILIVDEVLAVGDSAFQKKCLGKMNEVASLGRTVLFVSHNMAAVSNLCDKGVVLEGGEVMFIGDTTEAISYYLESGLSHERIVPIGQRTDRSGDGRVKVTKLSLLDRNGFEIKGSVLSGSSIAVKLNYECKSEALTDPNVAIAISAPTGECYLYLSTEILGEQVGRLSAQGSFLFHLPKFPLAAGRYLVNTWIAFGQNPADWVKEAAVIDVEDGDFYGSGKVVPSTHTRFLSDYSFSLE